MATPTSIDGRDPAIALDALERSRRHMLTAVVVTSILWIVPQILQDVLSEGLSGPARGALILAGLAGGLIWMVSMWRFHRFQQQVLDDPDLRRRLDDERVLALRREAIYRGWIVMVVAVSLGVAAAPFVELPDLAVLLTLLLLGVNAPIMFFLALDRD